MRIIGVHGWLYSDQRTYADPARDYALWAQAFQREILPFEYWSRPTFVQALFKGYLNNYHWAWDLALAAGVQHLPVFLSMHPGTPVVCHSLGSLAVLASLRDHHIDRVIIMGGAAFTDFARAVAIARPETTFINVYSKQDTVLQYLATVFGPKFRGRVIGRHGPNDICLPNWVNLEAPGATHGAYYTNPCYWPILQHALALPPMKNQVCGVNFPELPWNKRPKL